MAETDGRECMPEEIAADIVCDHAEEAVRGDEAVSETFCEARGPAEQGVNADFLKHMRAYIGQTVTVYTVSGGPSGEGITGVLMECGQGVVRLLTQMASAPECPRGQCAGCPFYTVCRARRRVPVQRPVVAGSIADIPIERIVMFVHSAV